MNLPKAILGLLAVFFGYLSSPVNAQINLKTGYSISFLSDPVINEVIANQNQNRNYSHTFHDLKWLHGFEAGLRAKAGVHAFELTYLGAYQTLRGSGSDLASDTPFKDKLKFSVQSAGLGYQLSSGAFGFGAEWQYQWYITRADLAGPEQTFRNVQHMWATKFYLMLILQGSGNVNMVISPYYLLPTANYDSKPLQDFLLTDIDREHERWTRFGLSIQFYNGRN